MSAKSLFSSILFLTIVGLHPVHGQTSFVPGAPSTKSLTSSPAAQTTALQPNEGLSDWIIYPRDYLAVGPVGGPGMGTELFLRVGPTVPFGARLGPLLDVGWMIQGGGRALFFNESQTAAWVVEPSISNHHNTSHRTDVPHSISILVPDPNIFKLPTPPPPKRVFFGVDPGVPGVTITDYNRTFVNLGFGRLWYLVGSANDPESKWRVGVDGGGRWGSASMQFNEIRHRTDVIGGAFLALHSSVEFPMGSFVLLGGFRTEWSYTWSDILQTSTDVHDINLLFDFGLRF